MKNTKEVCPLCKKLNRSKKNIACKTPHCQGTLKSMYYLKTTDHLDKGTVEESYLKESKEDFENRTELEHHSNAGTVQWFKMWYNRKSYPYFFN